jgi:hypothetical protein
VLAALNSGYRASDDGPEVAPMAVPVPHPVAPAEAEQEEEALKPRRRGRYQVVPQIAESDCGAAALATVARY